MLGSGVYTIPQASRLTNVPAATIRRWLYGYRYPVSGGVARGKNVIAADLPRRPRATGLSFKDLIELRFVEAFRRAGFPWSKLRPAAEIAARITGSDHPFSTNRFRTDGQSMYMDEGVELDLSLLNVLTSQRGFRRLIEPGLKDVDFAADDGAPLRWWPDGTRSAVVVDPRRAFGQPIVADCGVLTLNLAAAYRANRSYKAVASWYEMPVRSVRDAVRFENRLAA